MVASKMNIPEKMTVRLLMTSIFACLLWLCGFLYFSHERTAMEKMHLANQTSGLNMIYNCVVNAQEIGMQAYFDSFVMQPQVLEILHHAREGNEAEQAVQRVKLYRCLLRGAAVPLSYRGQSLLPSFSCPPSLGGFSGCQSSLGGHGQS